MAAFSYTFLVSSEPPKYLIYLTSWGLFLAAFAYTLQIGCSFYRLNNTSSKNTFYCHEKLLIFILNALGSLSILITLFYWIIVYPGLSDENKVKGLLDKVIGHGFLPFIFILDLLVFSTRNIKWQHFLHPLTVGFAYLIFSFAYHELGGLGYKTHVKENDKFEHPDGYPYIYSALNWEEEHMRDTLKWIGYITVAIMIIHLLLYATDELLRYCTTKDENVVLVHMRSNQEDVVQRERESLV